MWSLSKSRLSPNRCFLREYSTGDPDQIHGCSADIQVNERRQTCKNLPSTSCRAYPTRIPSGWNRYQGVRTRENAWKRLPQKLQVNTSSSTRGMVVSWFRWTRRRSLFRRPRQKLPAPRSKSPLAIARTFPRADRFRRNSKHDRESMITPQPWRECNRHRANKATNHHRLMDRQADFSPAVADFLRAPDLRISISRREPRCRSFAEFGSHSSLKEITR